MYIYLESMDTALEVPHPHSTQLPARRSPSFLFFFFPQIRADAARFVPNRLQFASNQADLARIGLYWPY